MAINDFDQLDNLTDDQLWEAAADTRNVPEIRQQAILRWLYPDETDADADPDELSGGRLRVLRQRATVLDRDETDEDGIEDVEEMAPYFDIEGRLVLEHDGVSYLIESLEDDGTYFGVDNIDNLYTTDDKMNPNRDM